MLSMVTHDWCSGWKVLTQDALIQSIDPYCSDFSPKLCYSLNVLCFPKYNLLFSFKYVPKIDGTLY